MDGLTNDDFKALAALSPGALLLTDRTARVVYANPAAERLLTMTTMLAVKAGILAARRKEEDRTLRNAVAALSSSHPASTICLRNRESVPMVVLDLRLQPGGLIVWRINDLASRPAPSSARLRTIFGLTTAEARVACAMLSGLGIQGVAKEHGVEPETVRSQVKRIRSKMGAGSQNHLVGILMAAGLDLGPDQPAPLPAD